jgi:tryptophanyl-tRNA synthetase
MTPLPKSRKRVLSGMRSTGKLHLGNYVGALQNWVRMQEEYECFFMVADWHALTTDYADTSRIKENSLEVVLDWLAAGLDPEKSVIFIQSHVSAHAELHLLFSMITPLGWVERVPTYKEQRDNIQDKDLGTYGFLGYPVLQSADILVYKADVVPVGEDQVAHIELTREIARRTDPGNPDICPVGDLHKIFSSEETMAKVNVGCRSAGIGCIECKSWAADALVQLLSPMQDRRKKFEENPRLAWDILEAGTERARKAAGETMDDVRAAMGMSLQYEGPK